MKTDSTVYLFCCPRLCFPALWARKRRPFPFLTSNGEEKIASAIQSLDASDRLQLLSPIRDSSWYPMETQEAMGRLTKALATPEDKILPQTSGVIRRTTFLRRFIAR